MIIFLLIIIGLPILGWYAFTGAFDALTGGKEDYSKPSKDTYITNNYYDNRSVHMHPSQEIKDLER